MRTFRAGFLLLPLVASAAALPAQARHDATPAVPVIGDALYVTPDATPSILLRALADTVPRRQRAVALSDGYETRLRIHRITAYTIVPLFAWQAYMGQRLWRGARGDEPAPGWVRPAHRAGAVAIAGAFGVNTVTGAMNLWETRAQPEGRVMRLAHAASMTTALAGFTYAGARLSQQAKTDPDKQRLHRDVALGSMGLTLVSGTLMWLYNR